MKKTMWMSRFLQASLLAGLMLLSGLTLAEEQSSLSNKIETIDLSIELIVIYILKHIFKLLFIFFLI